MPQGSLEALLEVLDQLIGADEAQQQGKDRAMALVRDEMAALGMELGKMQGMPRSAGIWRLPRMCSGKICRFWNRQRSGMRGKRNARLTETADWRCYQDGRKPENL